MEAGKSHNMLFTTSWRTRETRAGRFQSEGRRRWMSQLKKKENSPFLYLFVLLGPSTAWVMPTHTGEGRSLLSLLMQMLFFSGNTLTDNPRNNVLPAIWASVRPLRLTHRMNHHRDTHRAPPHNTIIILITVCEPKAEPSDETSEMVHGGRKGLQPNNPIKSLNK